MGDSGVSTENPNAKRNVDFKTLLVRFQMEMGFYRELG
jgi:hypothetical protein